MSWTDDEIDKLFRESEPKQGFQYKKEYWEEFASSLPVQNERKKFIWWWANGIVLVIFTGLAIFEGFSTNIEEHSQKSYVGDDKMSTRKSTMNGSLSAISDSKTEFDSKSENVNNKQRNLDLKLVDKQVKQNLKVPLNGDFPSQENTITVPKTSQYFTINESSDENSVDSIEPLEVTFNTDEENTAFPNTNLQDEVLKDNEKNFESNEVADEEFKLYPHKAKSTYTEAALTEVSTLKEKLKKHTYWLEINGGMQQAWIESNPTYADVSGKLAVAAGLSRSFGRIQLNYGLGVQLTKFSNLRIEDRTVLYGFGANYITNSYQFNSMYSVITPIELSYGFGRNVVQIGLIGSFNAVERLRRTKTVDEIETYNNVGYTHTDLISRIGLLPTIGYAYYVSEKTTFGAKFGAQVISPIQSDRFVGTPKSFPFEGQVYLRRTLGR